MADDGGVELATMISAGPNGSITGVLLAVVIALILGGCAALIFWIVSPRGFEATANDRRSPWRPGIYLEVMAFSCLALTASSFLFVMSLRNFGARTPAVPPAVSVTTTLPAEQPSIVPVPDNAADVAQNDKTPAPIVSLEPTPAPVVSSPTNTTASEAATSEPTAETPAVEDAGEIAAVAPAAGGSSASDAGVSSDETAKPPEVPATVLPSPASPEPAPDLAGSPEIASVPAHAEDTGVLIERGDALRRTGDFAAARLFYERAAEAGSAAAARAVGETFDPLVLDEAHARGVRGDAQAAAEWYRKAMAEGDAQASVRLQRLAAMPPG